MGALRNAFAMSVVVNVSLRPFVILSIILRRPISTWCVDVDSRKAWFSDAKFPHMTIRLLGFQVLVVPVSFICCGVRNFITKTILQ
eukprot:4546874-Prorocentrum_lima.AAC.1